MEINANLISTDISLYASYREPMFSLVEIDENRIHLFKNFMKVFNLRLDDIKIGREKLSGNFLNFIKNYDSALFNVSFGLEDTTSNIYKVKNYEQILDLYGRLFKILDEIPISLVKITISQHLKTDVDPEIFLESLNPNVPIGFKDVIKGRGVQYQLFIKEDNLDINILLIGSIFHDDAIFLNVENKLEPYINDFEKLSEIIFKNYNLIIKKLGINIQEKV